MKEDIDARNKVEKGWEEHGSTQCTVDENELLMWNKTKW